GESTVGRTSLEHRRAASHQCSDHSGLCVGWSRAIFLVCSYVIKYFKCRLCIFACTLTGEKGGQAQYCSAQNLRKRIALVWHGICALLIAFIGLAILTGAARVTEAAEEDRRARTLGVEVF